MGNARNIAFWVVLFLMILALFNAFGGNSAQMNSTQIAYSDFIQRVENDQVTAATIDGETTCGSSGPCGLIRGTLIVSP